MHDTLERVRAGEEDPRCTGCGGILKSATISFGENLVPDDLRRSQVAAAHADVFLALGTSLGVYPAAALPEIALRNGARLVVMNAEATDGTTVPLSWEDEIDWKAYAVFLRLHAIDHLNQARKVLAALSP